jgi:DNA-binding transcriptional regulator LsrR (DeoR family)
MFSVQVHLGRDKIEVARLEPMVKERYGLDQCLLVPRTGLMVDDLPREERQRAYREAIRDMAPKVVQFLDRIVEQAAAERPSEPVVIAVAGGVSLQLIGEHLLETVRPVRSDAVEFVTARGWLGSSDDDGIEPDSNVREFAHAYGARSRYVTAIGFPVKDETAIVTQPHQVGLTLKKVRSAKVVVSGLSHIPADVTEAKIANDPLVNAAVISSARRAGAIGAICHVPFDRDGRLACPSHGVVGLTLEDLRSIASEKGRDVLLVTGGDRRRWLPLKVALEKKLASVLVTDTHTARFLVGEIPL